LKAALSHVECSRQTPIKTDVADRGYRGSKRSVSAGVILPSAPLKRDSLEQCQRKKYLCQKRSAIEPIICHLKYDYRLRRNWLKGSQGDPINLLIAPCAWNLRK
jgi:IS5 family transposase